MGQSDGGTVLQARIAALEQDVRQLNAEKKKLARALDLAEKQIQRNRLAAEAKDSVSRMISAKRSELERYMQLLLGNCPDIILLFDEEQRIVYCTDSFLRLCGIPGFGMVRGLHCTELLRLYTAPDVHARVEGICERVRTERLGVGFSVSVDFAQKGEPRSYSVQASPMLSEDGAVAGSIIIFSDTTEIVAMKDAAEAATHAKSSFLAGMSHEIRTPLNAIIGMTSIGKSAAGIERKDYCFAQIEDASRHLLGIINDVLDMSKIEAGKLELSPVEFHFETLLRRVANVVRFRADERRQKFLLRIDAAIPQTLLGDDQRLAQVLTNLLSNAVKFTPEEGSVDLEARLLGQANGLYSIQVSVRDTGIGISPEQQLMLFRSFQQAESGTTRKFGGTGLGLAISKNIIELMGGRIWVESELGRGAAFIFTVDLPRGADGSQALPTRDAGWSSGSVLAVDGDAAVLDFLRETVRRIGISCDTASGAEEALRLLEEGRRYDIFFVGRRLPDMDGTAFTKTLREKWPKAGGTVVLMSPDSAPAPGGPLVQEQEAGVNQFLQKPLLASDVFNVLTGALGNRRPADKAPDDIAGCFAGCRVLLAEDMEINREIVTALLEPAGIEIDCAKDGAEAVRMFEEAPGRYDAIFMDIQMPVMDGYEATRRIRLLRAAKAKTVPIIAMTANVFKEDVEKSLRAGMNGHVGKPLDFGEVLEKLRGCLLPGL